MQDAADPDHTAAPGPQADAAPDAAPEAEAELVELSREDWLATLDRMGEERGYFEPLGPQHSAIFTDEGPVLLVSFETIDGIMAQEGDGLPLGWSLADAQGWSNLCLLGHEEGWFRENRVYRYFDRLIDDGFFEDFDRVIFYGAGACGYAAAAFSVAAPGASVLALAPQASLDPQVAGWDRRHLGARRHSFTDRFGYAPEMIEAAAQAFVLYDPEVREDAMHAALFTRPNVVKLPARLLGETPEIDLLALGLVEAMLTRIASGSMDRPAWMRMWRRRRGHHSWLRALLYHLSEADRPLLVALLARHVLRHGSESPRFRRAFEAAAQELERRGTRLPPRAGEARRGS